MKTIKLSLLATIFIAVGVGPTCGQGVTIFQHSGDNNPLNEGFLLASYGNPQLSPVINDLGVNAWSVRMTGSDAAQYSQTATAQQTALIDASSWDLSITLRILTAPTTPSQGILVDFETGTERFGILFGEESNDDPLVQVGGSSLSPVFVLNGAGSTYNNYQLIYDSTTDTAELWINGVEEISDVVSGPNITSFASLSWSDYQHLNSMDANWSLVSLQIVPEPSPSWLFLLGSGILIYVCRNRKLFLIFIIRSPARVCPVAARAARRRNDDDCKTLACRVRPDGRILVR
jgi:hypothetical protein